MGATEDLLSLIPDKFPFPSLTLPLAPVLPLSELLTHLTQSPVHPAYFPYVRLGALHAARVATVWAGLTKAYKGERRMKVGMMGDLFGYLVMCWGGSTIVPMLLGQQPIWLLSPTPWLTYIPIYLLLVHTTVAEYVHSTCPTILFNLSGAIIDGITRGTTACAIPAALERAGIPVSAWTVGVLGGIACTAGGIMVQTIGLHKGDWELGMPLILRGGILNTLDFWGGAIAALLYAALLRLIPELSLISDIMAQMIPSDLLSLGAKNTSLSGVPLVTPDTARSIVVLFLASLFLARVISLAILSPRPVLRKAKELDKVEKEVVEAVLHDKVENVEKRASRSRAGTPKKSPKVKSS